MTFPHDPQLPDFVRQLFGRKHFPINCQCDNRRIPSNIFKNPLAFFIFNQFHFVITGIIRRFFVRHFQNLQLTVSAQPFTVFIQRHPVKFLFNFPNAYNGNLHSAPVPYLLSNCLKIQIRRAATRIDGKSQIISRVTKAITTNNAASASPRQPYTFSFDCHPPSAPSFSPA